MTRLGPSSKAVYDYLVECGELRDAQWIGNDLYDKVSEWGRNKPPGFEATNKHRREWAQRLLKKLKRQGLVATGTPVAGFEGTTYYRAVVRDEDTGLTTEQVREIEEMVVRMLHAHRDCLRNQGKDTSKIPFDATDGYYGEAFGILRGISLLGHGDLIRGGVNHPEKRSNLQWWFAQLQDRVLKEENYPEGPCEVCKARYGKG